MSKTITINKPVGIATAVIAVLLLIAGWVLNELGDRGYITEETQKEYEAKIDEADADALALKAVCNTCCGKGKDVLSAGGLDVQCPDFNCATQCTDK